MSEFLIYKVYYSDKLAYVGQTTQELVKRMYQHFFDDCDLDYRLLTKIEFAKCQSMADMNVYEMYYINKLHPFENRSGISNDTLSVVLNKELSFEEYDISILEKYNKGGKIVFKRKPIPAKYRSDIR